MLFKRMPDKYLCVREPLENLLKTIKTECVWIITPSSNCNRKFSINKNTYLNTSETVEINKYWLNSLTNVMKISTSSLTSVFKNDKSDCLLCWFVSTHNEMYFIRFLRKMNYHIITALNLYQFIQMVTIYKQKADKIQPVSSFKSNEKASESDSGWQ